jgi:hypothetical protein
MIRFRAVMRLFVVLVPLAFAGTLLAKGQDPTIVEAKLKPEAAKQLAEYAGWCASHGAKKDGMAALDEALWLDAMAPKHEEVKAQLDALAADAPDAADAVVKERKARGPKIATAFDKLAGIEHDVKEAGRFEDYECRALTWDPTPARIAKIRKEIDDACSGNRMDEAGRLLVRVKRVDVEGATAGKYEKIELALATKDALLVGSDEHPLVGYVSLPKDWSKGKTYPILVGVEGAGCSFLGYCSGFTKERLGRQVIVVAPVTLSNTNELKADLYPCYTKALLDEWDKKRLKFDAPGIDALLAVVRKRFGGEEKVFLTGFSGGGKYTYFKLFQDPAHVRGAATACCNFGGDGLEGAPGAGEGGGPPVHLFTGEKDGFKDKVGNEPGIEPQTTSARENLDKLGYRHVEYTQVKGSGHSPLPALVWDFVDKVLGGK